MNILETIIESKKTEVEERKKAKMVSELERMPFFKKETFSFTDFFFH